MVSNRYEYRRALRHLDLDGSARPSARFIDPSDLCSRPVRQGEGTGALCQARQDAALREPDRRVTTQQALSAANLDGHLRLLVFRGGSTCQVMWRGSCLSGKEVWCWLAARSSRSRGGNVPGAKLDEEPRRGDAGCGRPTHRVQRPPRQALARGRVLAPALGKGAMSVSSQRCPAPVSWEPGHPSVRRWRFLRLQRSGVAPRSPRSRGTRGIDQDSPRVRGRSPGRPEHRDAEGTWR